MTFTLKKRKASRKDYSLHKSLKLSAPAAFPDELLLLSPIIDQGSVDICTACAAVAARYNETNGAVTDQNAFWQQELSFAGESSNTNGFDLQVPLSTAVEKGFPNYAPSAYFWITPNNGQDLFDSVRTALLTTNYPLVAGVMWDNSWTETPQGIVQSLGNSPLGGHCVKIAGFKTINGQPYIVIQNSWGTSLGDNGLWYFPRSVFNQAFAEFGIAVWSDSPNVQVKTLGMISALWYNIITLLTRP